MLWSLPAVSPAEWTTHRKSPYLLFTTTSSGLNYCLISWLCKIFSINFNVMSAVFARQSLAGPKKSILTEVCFDAKWGQLYMQVKWIFILSSRHFHPVLGCLMLNTLHFGAKYTAFWCKMQCVLMLNGVHFGAKRKVKWCKMQCNLLLNTGRCA